MRDLDAHVNLFAPDIRVGRDKVGCAHFKAWQDQTFATSSPAPATTSAST